MIEISRSDAFVAGLPLRIRRGLLRASWRARRLSRTPPGFGLAPVFESLLRVPRAEAARLDGEAVYADRLQELEWLALLNRPHRDIAADLRRLRVAGRALFERAATGGKPVILAPIHMGCFVLPLAGLIHNTFRGRRMLILRAREDHPLETRVMERINEAGVEMRFLNVRDKQDYIDAIRFARTGSVIVSFLDLPASYGVAADTTLFGRPVRLGLGIDGLARLTEGTVIPLSVTSGVAGDELHASEPFEVADNAPETRRGVVDRVRRHIEASVLRAPEQWAMWPRLDEFLIDDAPRSEPPTSEPPAQGAAA